MKEKYTITIFWSDEDEAYISVVEELEGCSAFGETREEALSEIKTAMQLWLDVAREQDDEIPLPQQARIPA